MTTSTVNPSKLIQHISCGTHALRTYVRTNRICGTFWFDLLRLYAQFTCSIALSVCARAYTIACGTSVNQWKTDWNRVNQAYISQQSHLHTLIQWLSMIMQTLSWWIFFLSNSKCIRMFYQCVSVFLSRCCIRLTFVIRMRYNDVLYFIETELLSFNDLKNCRMHAEMMICANGIHLRLWFRKTDA